MALVFIVVIALINFRGIAESVKLNFGLTPIELTGLLLVVRHRRWPSLADGGGDPARRASSSRPASGPRSR